MKQRVCPRCGEPVPNENAEICMVCGEALKKPHKIKPEHAAVVVFVVLGILLAYILYPIFFGVPSVTSTGNVRFVASFADGSTSIEYGGTADGRDLASLQVAILSEGGHTSQVFSFKDPQPGTVLGPIKKGTMEKSVGVYYVAVYADGSETSNTVLL